MCFGLALYGTDDFQPEKGYKLGVTFFKFMELDINEVIYFCLLQNGEHKGDHDVQVVDCLELEKVLKEKGVSDFRLLSVVNGIWKASFGFTTNKYGSYYHIDAQFPSSSIDSEVIFSFFAEAAKTSGFPYGIAYRGGDVFKAFRYAEGENLVNQFGCEHPFNWLRETPGRFRGKASYICNKLRMVYPYNVINEHHLCTELLDGTLKEWISSDHKNGVLRPLPRGLTFWSVEDDNLERVNNELGKQGLLIAWKPSGANKNTRKLP